MDTTETPIQKIKADLRRYAGREKAKFGLSFCIRMFLLTPGFQFVFARRVQEIVYKIPLIGRPLRRVMWWATCMIFGSELAIAAEFGGGLYIPHPFGIVVGAAKVGRNVSILQNVTIGRKKNDDPYDPTVEDGVMISAGAVVLGAITLGRNCSIGANSVCMIDVPENAIAVGIPAKVIMPKAAIAVEA